MTNRTEGKNSGDDAFDLGETSVGVRKPPPGRSWGRIVAAGLPVALGVFGYYLAVLLWPFGVFWPFTGLGSLFCGVGFAIYDYRWPFGPRPGRRLETRQVRSRREEEY